MFIDDHFKLLLPLALKLRIVYSNNLKSSHFCYYLFSFHVRKTIKFPVIIKFDLI